MTSAIDILNFKQLLETNLSSRQIVNILNALINATFEPLFKYSSLARELVLQALLQTQVDHRRKISIHDKSTTTAAIIYGVSQNNFDAIKLCELDRNILFQTVLYLEPMLKEALAIEQKLLKKSSKRRQLRLLQLSKITGININLLTPIARWSLPYLQIYLQFRERVAAKYFKFSFQESNRAKFNTKLHVDSEELNKNYLLALLKAIDKFDANRGTLTSYIAQWLKSARSAPIFDHQYGVSYTLPSNIRKLMETSGKPLTNMSVGISPAHFEIEDEATTDKLETVYQHDELFVKCLRHIPNIKIPMLVLDLPIKLCASEVTNLTGLKTE